MQLRIFAKIKRDEDDGVRAAVTGTPNFSVNGQKVRQLSEQALRRALETAFCQNRRILGSCDV